MELRLGLGCLGLGAVFGIDVASFGAALLAVVLLPPLVPRGGGRPAGLASVREGLQYLRGQRLLASNFWIELSDSPSFSRSLLDACESAFSTCSLLPASTCSRAITSPLWALTASSVMT